MAVPPTLHPSQPPHGYRPAKSNGFAITSLVLGITSIVVGCGPFTAFPGIIFGHLGLGRQKRDPEIGGVGMAIAGLIMSYLVMALTLVFILFIVLNPDIREGFKEAFEEASVEAAAFETVAPEDAEFVAFLPEGHDVSIPLPVAIWLHGYGSSPGELEYDTDRYQKLATEKGIAIVGVSATAILEKEDLGDGIEYFSYQWQEDTDADRNHIEAVLALHQDQVIPARGQVLLFGFSQGAKAAGDIASSNPNRYRGAGIFSPGGNYDPEVDFSQDSLENQAYTIIVGAGEHLGNVTMAETFDEDLRSLNADVFFRATENQDDHRMPTDEFELLSEWIDRALADQ